MKEIKLLKYIINTEKYIETEINQAIIRYYKNERIKSEEFFQNGELDRNEDKPAVIQYYEKGGKKKGQVKSEEWYKEGIPYREDNKPIRMDYEEIIQAEVEVEE